MTGKMKKESITISEERFAILQERYEKFVQTLDDLNSQPVRVFEALPQKALDELLLNREVSKELQKKKEEDMKKAAQAKEEEETPVEATKVESSEVKPEPEKEN